MVHMSIDVEKEKIRKAMRFELKKHPETDRVNKSRVITEKISNLEPFQKAKTIMFYDATDEEVSTRELMERAKRKGKRILLPYVDQAAGKIRPSIINDLDKDLTHGNYDIMEPRPEKRRAIPLNEIDVVLVPGLAFDRKGNRLGRGKGYYDQFLSLLPKQVKRFGLAFDFQVLSRIPVNDLDVPLDLVVTND